MSDPHEFLRTLVLVLGVAAVVTIIFQRLRQPVVAALAKQMAGSTEEHHVSIAHRRRASDSGASQVMLADTPEPVRTLAGIYDLIPGLGCPVSVEVGPEDYAVGRSLSELDLRDTTDATVLVIVRAAGPVILPVGKEVLHVGDVLALAGTEEAVNKARTVLTSGVPPTA